MMVVQNPEPLITNSILDFLASAVVVFDEDLRVCYLNQAAEMLLAVSAKHVIGEQPDAWISCHGDAIIDLINASEVGSPITKRGVVLTTERSNVTVDCTVTPIVDDDGRELTIVELQQIDRHLRISREEHLITQQALTRDVVRGLAHEIKNPLGGLRGAAQLLESELDSEDLKEYTHIIIQEADRLQELVNRMLGPNRPPSYAAVNLHRVLERVRSLVMAETGERLAIIRDYDPSIPDLVGDCDQLIQAMLNIVRNASRAIEDRGTVVLRTRILRKYTIGSVRHRLAAQIEIVDNGPGIPPEIADTLFLPMVTGGTGGMGLGLAIAQSLINQHRGLIECRSQPGETVFTVYLPVGGDLVAESGGGN
ncbi:MAG: nitrogen regulation protein NR(II) [Gammaproteobacteria bacterium]|nr:nitrogen regulation protein NR(II) [Gammaproteobacteria bacterium]